MNQLRYLKPNKQGSESDPFLLRSGRYKNGKLDTVYRTKWAEQTYITDAREKETVGQNFNFKKLPLIGAVLAVFLLAIIGKTAWLQIVKGEYYYQMAEGNRIRVTRIEPKRGVIYDRIGRPLVQNKPNFLLYFVPADFPEEEGQKKEILSEIGSILDDFTDFDLAAIVDNVPRHTLDAYQPLFITDNIAYDKAMLLYLKSANWPGVVLANKPQRDYLFYASTDEEGETNSTKSASHILGYTGKINSQELEQFGEEYLPIDYIGKMGIEYFWENELKGKSGKKQIEVDALGKEKKIIGEISAIDGHNLVLSVDIAVQLKLEEILTKHLEKNKLDRASLVALDPRNGEIISLISWPAFDNNSFARGITNTEYQELISHPDKPLFNRAISGEYPSGSTIKPVWAAAGLEEGVISERTTFLSVGGIQIGQWFFPDWRAGGHGRVDVRRAIAESVNTFFYNIGGGHDDFVGLGVDRLVHYGELFGLGTQTGIDLAGEASGFLPTRSWKEEVKGERWYIGDTYHLSIGQGDLLVTPLQVAVFTSVFANGGELYRPHFIREKLTSSDEALEIVSTEPTKKDFIDPYNIHVVREGMRRTVTDGSARSLSALPVEVAGKTGTAQWSSKNDHHAWFTGFAPFDEPEIVITVLLEEGGEGSEVAVPVARDFLEWYFSEYKESLVNDMKQ